MAGEEVYDLVLTYAYARHLPSMARMQGGTSSLETLGVGACCCSHCLGVYQSTACWWMHVTCSSAPVVFRHNCHMLERTCIPACGHRRGTCSSMSTKPSMC